MAEEKGLSKQQIIDYFQSKADSENSKSDLWKELYDKDDLSLVTENHAHMILPKVRMRLIVEAINPKRQKPLVQVWLDSFNAEMISFNRQGRLEGLGALQAMEAMDEERTTRL